MTYDVALLIDLVTIGLSALVLVRFGNLTHSHPATVYLVFHFVTFTMRVFALSNGAMPLWTAQPNFEGVREGEITRAMSLADVALVSMTLAWLFAARRPGRVISRTGASLDRRIVLAVVGVALPLGVWGSTLQLRFGGETLGTAGTGAGYQSGYFQILPEWPALVLLVLIYVYGFRWWLVAPMGLQLAVVGTQGYHRFRAVIPAILMIQMWLDRRGRRWPTRSMVVLLFAMALVFYPLKRVGRLVQQGANLEEIVDQTQDAVSDALVGRAEDQALLDEFAMALTLLDENGKWYLGEPYVALATLPVPRFLWPEKPAVSDYIKDFSRPWRPMYGNGMVVTFLGEAYANFGYVGIAIIPFLLAFVLARVHQSLFGQPYGTLWHFAYLLVACNLIQVYRDGLTSIVFFVLVHMMPLAAIVLIQVGWATLVGRSAPVSGRPLARGVSGLKARSGRG